MKSKSAVNSGVGRSRENSPWVIRNSSTALPGWSFTRDEREVHDGRLRGCAAQFHEPLEAGAERVERAMPVDLGELFVIRRMDRDGEAVQPAAAQGPSRDSGAVAMTDTSSTKAPEDRVRSIAAIKSGYTVDSPE